ncbi:class I SAM-dependent methyltransferase [Streptomyces uncialis]|uniref:class I SAM-dependent methyltransferase n=1 Tax=Streptomyces uncialis TaxID=1048205 RepID=UPI0036661400
MEHQLTTEAAAAWVARWEDQQELYATAREERFHVIADVVAHAAQGQRQPRIADLGCGPGSLASRLAARLPHARVTAVDCDPLLLALGQAQHSGTVDFVDARIGTDPWVGALDLTGALDAAVSATALHYLPPEVLSAVYEQIHDHLRPGGILVNADHLFQQDAPVRELAAAVARGHDARRPHHRAESWEGWWAAAAAEPQFGDLFTARAQRALGLGSDNGLSAQQHMELMRKAGFEAVGSVWQYGHSCVVVAVRG